MAENKNDALASAERERLEGPVEHPTVRYERRDVPFPGVLAVILAAICLGAVQLYSVWQFFLEGEQHLNVSKASRYPLAPPPSLKGPPEPRLEQLDRMSGNEKPNVAFRERAYEQLLSTYGATADDGYIRVPIQRAMEHVIADLPIRKGSAERSTHDNGLIDAGDSNSGRLFRGPPP